MTTAKYVNRNTMFVESVFLVYGQSVVDISKERETAEPVIASWKVS